jgi:hypothetical protein
MLRLLNTGGRIEVRIELAGAHAGAEGLEDPFVQCRPRGHGGFPDTGGRVDWRVEIVCARRVNFLRSFRYNRHRISRKF